jgi:hypothetical protein
VNGVNDQRLDAQHRHAQGFLVRRGMVFRQCHDAALPAKPNRRDNML